MARMLSQRGLQAFSLTMLTGSVSAAATTLNRSQPAVSRLLAELQDEIGFRLFDRVKGRLEPTNEGRLLFEAVQRSFIGLDRIASIAGEIRMGRHGTLAIGSMPLVAASILPKVVAQYARERPGTAVVLQSVPSSTVVQMVFTRECDLGFIGTAVAIPGLQFVRQFRLACLCIMPAGHHLAEKALIEPADLDGEAMVTLSASTVTGQQFEAILHQHGIDKLTRVETHLTPLAASLVLEGAGIGIVDSITAANHVAQGGIARPFRPLITLEFSIVCLDEAKLTVAQEHFIAVCEQRIGALADVSAIPGP